MALIGYARVSTAEQDIRHANGCAALGTPKAASFLVHHFDLNILAEDIKNPRLFAFSLSLISKKILHKNSITTIMTINSKS